MKFYLKVAVVLAVLGAAGAFGYPYVMAYWRARNKVAFRESPVLRGDITSVVNSTGTVQPTLRVQIGTFVSGPIEKLYVDYNTEVREGDLMAKIDPRIYQANVLRDEAILATANAEVARVTALLQQAKNDEQRANALRATNKDYISDTELDKYKYTRISLEAQLAVAKASIKQADASLQNSQANLGYTEIKSPVDGVVIDRKIDPGQTLAAQFQTPELFIVAPDMRKKMHVFAAVDEADVGFIRDAQKRGENVQFTVDAYRDDLFEGKIYQIRVNPTTTQNVVTYTVVVEAPNPDLKLLPGMTATLSFHIAKHAKILKVPNSALRFYPKPEQVRPEDQAILEGAAETAAKEEDAKTNDSQRSASERAKANQQRHRRHVWVLEGEFLKAVEIVTGLNDNQYTELVSGKIVEGQKLVTGTEVPKP
ncbi:MAG: efflux RND transporter periplasmic adaptor subunit [Pirellulales bacterium]